MLNMHRAVLALARLHCDFNRDAGKRVWPFGGTDKCLSGRGILISEKRSNWRDVKHSTERSRAREYLIERSREKNLSERAALLCARSIRVRLLSRAPSRDDSEELGRKFFLFSFFLTSNIYYSRYRIYITFSNTFAEIVISGKYQYCHILI